jgi:hypothetical protein
MDAKELQERLKGFEPWAVTCEDNHIVFGPFGTERLAVIFAAAQTIESKGECLYRSVPFALVLDEERIEELATIMGQRRESGYVPHGYL